MKQFQLAYGGDEQFLGELEGIARWRGEHPSCAVVFRIYTGGVEEERLRRVCALLDERMPDALYFGCVSNANIMDGAMAAGAITMSCTVFERATTRVELMQLPFTEESAGSTARALADFCRRNPWVKSVEINATLLGVSAKAFCDAMSALPDGIQVYGGGASNPSPDQMVTTVFSKGSGPSEHSAVFLLTGGEDYHLLCTQISGWKPFRRRFRVTKASREVLYELDGQPAFDVYRRFLNISRSDQLISNTLEFPLFMDHNGVDVLRCPMGLGEDDSLVLATEVEQGADVRLAYGDPVTILASIRHDGQAIANFRPEVIQAFSCAARRFFWGDENISDETILLNRIAPTSGFYTSGEFLRLGGDLCVFNITLVLIAMREGEAKGGEVVDLYDERLDNIENERLPLIRRFVSFIDASTAELEELNARLAVSSITDGLTGLYYRAEIERRIRGMVEARARQERPDPLSLIMLDIDDFKRINDRYGHREGDRVIAALADVLREATADTPGVSLGRWGGEEFMALLPCSDLCEAEALAERIRAAFEAVSYPAAGPQTVSIGVAQARAGEDADALYVRVDRALYRAKDGGKNRVSATD